MDDVSPPSTLGPTPWVYPAETPDASIVRRTNAATKELAAAAGAAAAAAAANVFKAAVAGGMLNLSDVSSHVAASDGPSSDVMSDQGSPVDPRQVNVFLCYAFGSAVVSHVGGGRLCSALSAAHVDRVCCPVQQTIHVNV